MLRRQFRLPLRRNLDKFARASNLANNTHCVDEELALQWWHRVAARQHGEYYLQGWKRGRIYPDFVAIANEIGGVTHVMIFDTKGQHLEGNLDTEYKRKVLKTLEGAFNTAGRMVVRDGPTCQGIFQLVFSEQEFLEISARLDIETYSLNSR